MNPSYRLLTAPCASCPCWLVPHGSFPLPAHRECRGPAHHVGVGSKGNRETDDSVLASAFSKIHRGRRNPSINLAPGWGTHPRGAVALLVGMKVCFGRPGHSAPESWGAVRCTTCQSSTDTGVPTNFSGVAAGLARSGCGTTYDSSATGFSGNAASCRLAWPAPLHRDPGHVRLPAIV